MNFDDLIFDPPVPREWVYALALIVALLTVINYARRNDQVHWFKRLFMAIFRLGIIAGVTIVLMRPMQLDEQPAEELLPVFDVLLDVSKSMNTNDVEERSRLKAATTALLESSALLKEIGQHAEVQFYTFDDTLTPLAYDHLPLLDRAEGEQTDLGNVLSNVGGTTSNRRKAGALMISDGRDNPNSDSLSAALFLRSLDVPVWTTTMGGDTQTKDVYVMARIDQSFLFKEQIANIKVDVAQSGFKGWYAQVRLKRNGVQVATQQVILDSTVSRISFPIKESERGLVEYTVEVSPLNGESDEKNNIRSVFVQVVDEKTKVLLIEAQPYWDSKFLLRALQADPNLDVTSIFYMNDNKTFAVTQSTKTGEDSVESLGNVRVPKTKEELFKYDTIILGRGVDEIFTAKELGLFRAYVGERGGSLIFSRGQAQRVNNDVLSELEPVVWDEGILKDARFQLTAAGRTNPVFNFGSAPSEVVIRDMPKMLQISRVKEEKMLTVILAKGENSDDLSEMAVVSYQRYGKGKVLSIGASGMWRWAFTPKTLSRYDEVYAKFWGQMIRWLVYGSDFLPGQDITFSTDKNTFNLGETVGFSIHTKQIDTEQYRPRITLTAPDGTQSQLNPESYSAGSTVYSATIFPEQEGDYEAVLHNNIGMPKEETVRFLVYNDLMETRYVAADPDRMARIAEITGGAVLSVKEWAQLPDVLEDQALARQTESKPHDVWDTWTVLLALMAALAVEWFMRRRTGLL